MLVASSIVYWMQVKCDLCWC